MTTLQKHIALWLFGIFSFPILFQSGHTVLHHLHGYRHTQHQCMLCSTGRPDPTSCAFDEEGDHGEGVCPICEYQFSINQLPEATAFDPVVPMFFCNQCQSVVPSYYRPNHTTKSPRAPPV
ncbi:MAG: hypothetical protein PHU33_00055 [Bacteroidales bacterium]|nr:hypothetical protein [Bacteroidales bacterium]